MVLTFIHGTLFKISSGCSGLFIFETMKCVPLLSFLIFDTVLIINLNVLYSEPVPDNSANAVKVAVAKNFDELVANSKKVSFGNCYSY
jgi:hypothetical protein